MNRVVPVPHNHKDQACPHVHKRVNWKASHLYKIGAGGYYQVGVFDTTVSCHDCKRELYVLEKEPPLCQTCLAPMVMAKTENGITTCDDALTDVFLVEINLNDAKRAHQNRLKKFWRWHSLREDKAEENYRKQKEAAGQELSLRDRLGGTTFRMIRGNSILQVWPYVCTSSNCTRQGRLKWLQTPGD